NLPHLGFAPFQHGSPPNHPPSCASRQMLDVSMQRVCYSYSSLALLSTRSLQTRENLRLLTTVQINIRAAYNSLSGVKGQFFRFMFLFFIFIFSCESLRHSITST